MQDIVNNNDVKYAGFWKRLISYILDFFVLCLPIAAIQKLIFGNIDNNQIAFFDYRQTVNLFGWCIYYVLLETSKWQGTVGKKVKGLKVTNLEGGMVTVTQALTRYWMIVPACLLLFVGIIMIAFTDKKQGLHDKVAKVLVVCS
jgi:uncharacterized RDD family membrane protein YckC